MLPALIIGGVAAGTVTAAITEWVRSRKRQRALTPERAALHAAALTQVKDPDELRSLANQFDIWDLDDHALLLRKRAALRELPQELKYARADAFRKMMASRDVAHIHRVASAFQNEGATSAAANLRRYASGLSATQPHHVQAAIADLHRANLKPQTRQTAIANLQDHHSKLK
jgi:hypothetical protein